MPFEFSSLTAANIADWRAVASDCPYAHLKALDETFLNSLLAAPGPAGIVYSGGAPAAVFSADPPVRGRLGLRIVRASYAGIFVAKGFLGQVGAIRDFVFGDVLPARCDSDILELSLPPTVTVASEASPEALAPQGAVRLHQTVVFAALKEDLLKDLRSGARYEVRKGTRDLDGLGVAERGDPRLVDGFLRLEEGKSRELAIEPISRAHFERVLVSPFYHPLIAFDGEEPLAGVIYTCCREVATFHFNASTRPAKKRFLNKALLYRAMEASRKMGARSFLLGDGFQAGGNLERVTYFKRSFSTGEAENPTYLLPFSWKGWLLTRFKTWKHGRMLHGISAENS